MAELLRKYNISQQTVLNLDEYLSAQTGWPAVLKKKSVSVQPTVFNTFALRPEVTPAAQPSEKLASSLKMEKHASSAYSSSGSEG